MRWIISTVAFTALLGCGGRHQSPSTYAPAAAELRASAGATIVAVDGRKVASGDVANQGEQTSRASAGLRKVNVFTHGGHGSGEWTVPIKLEGGHVYRFAPASATALSLRVVDETSGEILIGGSSGTLNSGSPPSPPSVRP